MGRNESLDAASAVTGAAAAPAAAIPVAGPFVSAGLSGLSGILQLAKKPKEHPVPAELNISSNRVAEQEANLAAQTGLSQADYNKVYQLRDQANAEQLAAINSLPPMSLFDRQRLATALTERMKNIDKQFAATIPQLDTNAALKVASATSQLADEQRRIQGDITNIKNSDIAYKDQAAAYKASALGSMAENIGKMVRLGIINANQDKDEAEKEKILDNIDYNSEAYDRTKLMANVGELNPNDNASRLKKNKELYGIDPLSGDSLKDEEAVIKELQSSSPFKSLFEE